MYDNCYSNAKSHKDYDKLSVKMFEYAENIDLNKVENLLEQQISSKYCNFRRLTRSWSSR